MEAGYGWMDIFHGGWELVEVYFVWLRVFLDIFYGLTGVSECEWLGLNGGIFWINGGEWIFFTGGWW